MSPQLRGLKAREVIRAFQKAGGVVRSGKGDHVNIKMPNGRIVTLRSVGKSRSACQTTIRGLYPGLKPWA